MRPSRKVASKRKKNKVNDEGTLKTFVPVECMYRLCDYHFDLPRDLIARMPAKSREEALLMIVDRKKHSITHAHFADFPEAIPSSTFLVLNNTRVIPVRLFGMVGGKPVEMLVVAWKDPWCAEVLAQPAARLKPGTVICLSTELHARVEHTGPRGRRMVRFSAGRERVLASGFAPLPPYIQRRHAEAARLRDFDLERYQTVFARQPGSIAAPTAGLHFTPEMLQRIREKWPVLEVTLQVGETTFQKIASEDIRGHRMGLENAWVPHPVRAEIDRLKQQGRKLLAVGTTTVRALESQARLRPLTETFATDLFIYPGVEFLLVDQLLTNFHLPESSLFIMVAAFAGLELIKEAYALARERRYRFFSYGDAMLIL